MFTKYFIYDLIALLEFWTKEGFYNMVESKTIEDSKSIQYHAIVPGDLNGGGSLFGGTLLRWFDELAGIVA